MSDAPTDPGPERAPDADAARSPTGPAPTSRVDTDPASAGSSTGGPAGPPEPPADDERPPLRPVDWDGSFSSTWNSRYAKEVTNRLAAEHERELSQREHEQMMQEFREKANADADARDAEARDEQAREWLHAAESLRAGDDARSRLFDKLGKLERPSSSTTNEFSDVEDDGAGGGA